MDKKIRILYMTLTSRMGGIETFQKNVFTAIDRNKYEFTFSVNGVQGAFEKELKAMGGTIYHLPNAKHLLRYIKSLWKLLKQNPFDIVHIHKCSCANFLPLLICKITRTPYVIVHAHASSSYYGIMGTLLNTLGRICILYGSDCKVACSKEAANWLYGKRYCKRHSIKIIQNGIPTKEYQYNEDLRGYMRKSLHCEDAVVVGHVGRFQEAKNHEFLLHIFQALHKQHPNTVLLLLGSGEKQEEIKTLAAQLNIAESIIFMGECHPIMLYYQAMDIFLFPSLYEAMPMTLIEAEANGLTCLVSEEIHVKEMLPSIHTLSLTESKEMWAEQAWNLTKLSRIETKQEIEKFDISKTVEQLLHLYKERG